MVLYPNKLPESERVCSGICKPLFITIIGLKAGDFYVVTYRL